MCQLANLGPLNVITFATYKHLSKISSIWQMRNLSVQLEPHLQVTFYINIQYTLSVYYNTVKMEICCFIGLYTLFIH